jgi:hypothetical protein
VPPALARERLAAPAGPAITQSHPGELGHEVELAGPDVAEGDRAALESAVDLQEVMRDQALMCNVELVDAPVTLLSAEDPLGFALRKTLKLVLENFD